MKRVFLYTAFLFCLSAYAEDWPAWRGQYGDGISRETGILKNWPARGLDELWRLPVGPGISAMSVVDDVVFTLVGGDSYDHCIAVDAKNGRLRWRKRIGYLYHDRIGTGPRSTPAVSDGKVYVVSGRGEFWCLDAKTGAKIWHHNIFIRFHAKKLGWGICSSPLIYKDLVLFNSGGEGESIIALDKKSGALVWKTGDFAASYSTPIVATISGQEQVIFFTGNGLVGIRPGEGKILWHYKRGGTPNATPIANSEQIFISTGSSALLLDIKAQGENFAASEVWRSNKMRNDYTTSILWQGHVYGFHRHFLKCLELRTAKDKWKQRGFRTGFPIAIDGHLLYLSQGGELGLVELNPEEHVEKGRFRPFVPKDDHYTTPSVSNGRLFVRNQREIACYDLTGKRK